MFDFLESDWFVITLEIVFLILIVHDVKKYMNTKKKEYIVNIVLTIGFAIWTLYPMYKSYFGWDETQKEAMLLKCEDSNDTKLCKCINDKIFKMYVYQDYKVLDINTTKFQEFLNEGKEDCLDDSWF